MNVVFMRTWTAFKSSSFASKTWHIWTVQRRGGRLFSHAARLPNVWKKNPPAHVWSEKKSATFWSQSSEQPFKTQKNLQFQKQGDGHSWPLHIFPLLDLASQQTLLTRQEFKIDPTSSTPQRVFLINKNASIIIKTFEISFKIKKSNKKFTPKVSKVKASINLDTGCNITG